MSVVGQEDAHLYRYVTLPCRLVELVELVELDICMLTHSSNLATTFTPQLRPVSPQDNIGSLSKHLCIVRDWRR
jgi:hypothetical protein